MNLMYLPTKKDFYSDDSAISLTLAALFMTKNSEQSFLDSCRGISFKQLITRIEDVSSVPQEFHKKGFVDVLLVELDVNLDDDLQDLQVLLDKDFRDIPVIVTARDVTLNVARELMYMGVVDVLTQPFTETDILMVLKRASEKQSRHGAPAAKGKVISFI